MNKSVQQIFQGIVDGEQEQVAENVDAALQAGVPARTILDEGMLAAIKNIDISAVYTRVSDSNLSHSLPVITGNCGS